MAQILVVEDDLITAQSIRDVLVELAGHAVRVAGNGIEGLMALEETRHDLIISDVLMPRMDGFKFYEAVRANPAWVFIPFVFLTGGGQPEDTYFGMRMGADAYLVKPCDGDTLIATVESKLARARAISQATANEMDVLKRSVARALGHELRTPLTWIQGYAELLLSGADSLTPEELQMSLQGIKAGSDRLARMVEDGVLAVLLETGQAREEFELLARVRDDLGFQIEQAIERVASLHAQPNVWLEQLVEPGLPAVRIHPRFFAEAMVRLIEQAINPRRTDREIRLVVSARAVAGGVEVRVYQNGPAGQDASVAEMRHAQTVRDPGTGYQIRQPALADANQPVVTQLAPSESEEMRVGLGLSVARGLIELQGGQIAIGGGPEDRAGSSFTLPAVDVSAA